MAGSKNKARRVSLAMIMVAIISWNTAMVAEDAASLFKTKCAACHGADGKGETPVGKKLGLRDFTSPEVQKMSDEELTTIIADGKGKMPGYKKTLKPEQIKDLTAYIRDLASKK